MSIALEDKHGFVYQEKPYTCGPNSLRHALLVLGKPLTRDRVNIATRPVSPWEGGGTDEVQLRNAIKRFGFSYDEYEEWDDDPAKKTKKWLDNQLAKHHPVLLNIYNGAHWVTAIGKVGSKYVIADSYVDKVVVLYDWNHLRESWFAYCEQCSDPDEVEYVDQKDDGMQWCRKCDGYGSRDCGRCRTKGCVHCGQSGQIDCEKCNGRGVTVCDRCEGQAYSYYGLAVIPFKNSTFETHNAISRLPDFVGSLLSSRYLRDWWGYYLVDLIDCFGDSLNAGPDAMPAKEFFGTFGPTLVDKTNEWVDSSTEKKTFREFANYCLVAEAYDMQVNRKRLKEDLIAFSACFVMTIVESAGA